MYRWCFRRRRGAPQKPPAPVLTNAQNLSDYGLGPPSTARRATAPFFFDLVRERARRCTRRGSGLDVRLRRGPRARGRRARRASSTSSTYPSRPSNGSLSRSRRRRRTVPGARPPPARGRPLRRAGRREGRTRVTVLPGGLLRAFPPSTGGSGTLGGRKSVQSGIRRVWGPGERRGRSVSGVGF